MTYKLLTLSQPKIDKSNAIGEYLTAFLHLAPYNLSGYNICPKATPGCIKACLNTAGRGKFDSIQEARIIKTLHFIQNREGFLKQLDHEINKFINHCKKQNKRAAIRLNGTSDIRWEYLINMPSYDCQFYDYTKFMTYDRYVAPNYHLTYSYNENWTGLQLLWSIEHGHNVAMVFENNIPNEYMGIKVIDGTTHDLRFLDPQGVIVGLKALGDAKKDVSNFVIRGAA